MLRKLVVGPIQANCYILGCRKSGEAAVIDPGGDPFRILQEVSKHRMTVRVILFTHGHPDHTGGAGELRRVSRAPAWIHPLDAGGLARPPEGQLHEGQEIVVGTYTITVLHTPGHSPGGVCFSAPGAVFTGDTLFAGSVGRTDFPGGDHQGLIRAVREKIFPLGDSVRVYPGHGPASTVGRERTRNPFFR